MVGALVVTMDQLVILTKLISKSSEGKLEKPVSLIDDIEWESPFHESYCYFDFPPTCNCTNLARVKFQMNDA